MKMVVPHWMIGIFCILGCFMPKVASWSVEDFGAKHSVNLWEIAVKNADALYQTILAANASDTDRTVVFPAGRSYYMYALNISDVFDITFILDGKLIYSDDIQHWPTENFALLRFLDCEGIHFDGEGMVDGQGLKWWRLAYIGIDNRPNMLSFETTRDISIQNLFLYSSPKYSINFKDCRDVIIHDVTIYINSSMVRGKDHHNSKTYALNTDGIDIAAYNVTIYNTNITNYDDGIVAKPCRSNWIYCQCAGNILAYNNTISYSTGLTIGSVPPNAAVNCVRNVTFRDTTMFRPFKAIYIKSNSGTSGTGIVEDITYENIYIKTALWWTIWIGPQQQNQPGGDSGTGCNFLFPFIPVCPTQPLVTINRITLRNIKAENTLPLFEGPGVILCDPANPCTNIIFENVTNTMFNGTMEEMYAEMLKFNIPGIVLPAPTRSDDWDFQYLTSNVYGEVAEDSVPTPCFNDESCFWQVPTTKPN